MILSVPVSLYILGSLIKNIFLIQYGIVDFNPFQIDLIYTGLIFIIIVSLHIYFFTYKTSFIQKDYNYKNILQEIVIIIILCNFELLFFTSILITFFYLKEKLKD